MRKLIVLGIDSLDPALVRAYIESMPNFASMVNSGLMCESDSVFPADSIPAWISIFTGLSPANHGIIHSFDVFQTDWKNIMAINPESFKDMTFWTILAKAGYSNCVLFPELCYPPWDVNGAMVGRSLNLEVASVPKGLITSDDRSNLAGITGAFPGRKNLESYFENVMNLTRKEGEFALRMSSESKWDMFFAFFAWLDIVSHFFWRYMDPTDPRHPPGNPLKDCIQRYYGLLDQIIGSIRSRHPDAAIMVISDHGHGMRPPKTVNINVVLREAGFLKESGGAFAIRPWIQETIKRALLDVVMNLELDEWMLKLGTRGFMSEVSKDVYMANSILSSDSKARLSSFAGPKSYSWGGIDVASLSMTKQEYEAVRTKVIELMEGLADPDSGEKLVEWVSRREDRFAGKYLEKYPDIVFKLKDGYGAYWSTRRPLVGRSYEHNLSSGGHRSRAVLAATGIDINVDVSTRPTILDISPTILDYFGVIASHKMDGKSLLKHLE